MERRDHLRHEGTAGAADLVRAHRQLDQQARLQPYLDPDHDGVSERTAAGTHAQDRRKGDLLIRL